MIGIIRLKKYKALNCQLNLGKVANLVTRPQKYIIIK